METLAPVNLDARAMRRVVEREGGCVVWGGAAGEEKVAQDPTIRNPFDGGYVQTRAKFTRIPDKWHIGYRPLTATEKGNLQTFEKSVGIGADSFSHPDLSGKTVRFLGPVIYRRYANSLLWTAEMDLEEV